MIWVDFGELECSIGDADGLGEIEVEPIELPIWVCE